MKYLIILLFAMIWLVESCQPEANPPASKGGKLILEFTHSVDDKVLQTDSIMYVNEAGNLFGVNEVKYFISDAMLLNRSGDYFAINDEKVIHYVDIDLPETLKWLVFDPIPQGVYDSLIFIFGLNEERNQPFVFVNPPEVNMFWPDILGGGYHYLMINGKWKTPDNMVAPFDFHLGIGQEYSGSTTSIDSITGYVHNYFRIAIPLNGLTMDEKATRSIHLNMDINSWFCTPNTWDFNMWGGYIMQNQAAMKTASENGVDVFSAEISEK
jgi:hypothetical protein